MRPLKFHTARKVAASLLCFMPLATWTARGQEPQQRQPQQDEDVIRITSELIHTGVTVFDKEGRFVDGLRAEQFELRVDGKPQPISFFERVVVGSEGEEASVRAAKGDGSAPRPRVAPAGGSVRGRTIVFFVDDMHLSLDSLGRTRKVISNFIESEMGFDDRVAVASSTGQIGFLQQFTGSRAVLRAALGRLVHRSFVVRDAETVQMTEYQALRIEQGDPDALNYYVTKLMQESSFKVPGGGTIGPPPSGGAVGRKSPPPNSTGGLTREGAQRLVKERASLMLRQSSAVSLGTLTALESLMRTSAQTAGRKLVFFFSDGFYLNDRETAFGDRLKRITDAAARAGVVVYSIDARGLVSMTDASSNRADSSGLLSRANVGEVAASQDPLTALAGDTGGRALLNIQALDSAFTRALEETSNYYLLAWRPDPSEPKGGKFREVEVSVAGRPDLTVRLPRGFYSAPPDAPKGGEKSAKPDPEARASSGAEAELRSALSLAAGDSRLPTLLSSTFIDTPNHGPVLTNSVQVSTEGLDYGADGKQAAAIDLAGVILNDQGKAAASFKTRLDVRPPSAGTGPSAQASVIYNHRAPLAPGIYQVRAAARDSRGGRVGSAAQWVEIPDISSKKLTLSSLLLGGQFVGGKGDGQPQGAAEPQLQFSVARRFARAGRLDFLMFVYNASRLAGGTPDLTARVQVFREGRTVVDTPHRKLDMAGVADTARIPYGGGFPLATLAPGRYELRITVNDRAAQASASQSVAFNVE